MPRKARSRRDPCPKTEALSEQIGETVARLRKAESLSLGELSEMSGVAKSMISQIEKNESNPTVATLSRLSQALGTSVGAMFSTQPSGTALVQHASVQDIPRLTSDDGLCELRIIGPAETVQYAQIYDFTAQPGGVLVSSPHPDGTIENLSVLTGELEVRVELERWTVGTGETLRYRADRPHSIHNRTDRPAHATMVNMLALTLRAN